jgi:pimeloyl-ACP methyl ester carboxylesterase
LNISIPLTIRANEAREIHDAHAIGPGVTMPVLALGGSEGVGDALRATVASIGDRVQGGSITGSMTGCGHFLPEECPDELTEAVLKFWQSTPR